MKAYFNECLFFGKPSEGSIIPNWMLGILSWLNIGVIIFSIIHKIL